MKCTILYPTRKEEKWAHFPHLFSFMYRTPAEDMQPHSSIQQHKKSQKAYALKALMGLLKGTVS